jgi:hypothetical protein
MGRIAENLFQNIPPKSSVFCRMQFFIKCPGSFFSTCHSASLQVLNSFLEYIEFHMIPANILMQEIHPLGLVPHR